MRDLQKNPVKKRKEQIMFWFSNKKEEKENKNFNVIITGYGGQGVLTITELISKIALSKTIGYNNTRELIFLM